MMNEASKIGIQEILSSFDDSTLFSLTTTVTQGLLKNKVESRPEAINAIINYSPDVISILKRKLVTRETLFSYLHKNNVPINIPATKVDLISTIAKFWSIKSEQEVNTTRDSTTANSAETISLLAEQFSQWFYSMLNSDNGIGPEHFYGDAKLKLNMIANGQVIETEFIESNPELITRVFVETKTKYNLHFNPNLTKEGVQGRIDPHGLVMVLACGTLHAYDTCIGIFDQVFALARDPFSENNWKIKCTEVNLKSQSNVVAFPSLCDSELTGNLLTLPSS